MTAETRPSILVRCRAEIVFEIDGAFPDDAYARLRELIATPGLRITVEAPDDDVRVVRAAIGRPVIVPR